MRIVEIATQADVNVQTLRFYEREGLLRNPARTPGGYRSYERQDLDRIRFIRACQGLGFTLREIRQFIRLHRVTVSSHQGAPMQPAMVKEILAIAEERIESIEEKITTLTIMRSEMSVVIRALSSSEPARCPARPTNADDTSPR
jgi:MerR family transcriptional regulator, copper efflux regulator